MINLYTHILNFLQINEASFSAGDWEKHDYKYVISVLTFIKDKNYIIIGDKNDSPKKYLKFTDLIDKNKINDFINNILYKSVKDFNDFFNPLKCILFSNSKFDNVIESGTVGELFKNGLWFNIFKGEFSGKSSSEASYGQMFESLVCFIYNYGETNIDNWVSKYNVDSNNVRFQNWIKSSKISADILNKKFDSSKYIALHIGGHNLFYNNEYNKFIPIQQIYSGKEGIKSVFKTNKFDNIYPTRSKDKWNPADIVLVEKDLDIDEFKEEASLTPDGQGLNMILVKYLLEDKIIPVSLKMIDDSGKLYKHNINKDTEIIEDTLNEISDVKIIFGKTYEPNKLTGSIYVNGNPAEIQFRAQTGNDNLSIEAKLSNNKNARGGKGITVVKQALQINSNDNSYYKEFTNNQELYDYFIENNFDIDLNKNSFNKLSDKIPNLYKRICFKGIAGLIEKYKEVILHKKNKNLTKDDVILFTKFIWEACTKCPGAYYIIK